MDRSLEGRVARAIERGQWMAAGDRVGVAVSGGADSVALLRLLLSLRGRLGITLSVVHYNHKLRKESEEDCLFVQAVAAELQVPFHSGAGDVAATAKRNKWNLEDAGRRLRYEFFAQLVRAGQAKLVAVAHTLDDQAETVLARILRGTGPAGLAGIRPTMKGVVRPLLGVRREELRTYLRTLKQPWREDATNRDLTRQRARIRARLLPLLERDFSPHAATHLANLARLSEEEGRFWVALTENRFQALAVARKNESAIPARDLLDPLRFSREGSGNEEATRSLTERLIRRLYQERGGSGGELEAVHVEQVIHLARESQSGRRIELPGKVRVWRQFGDLIFSGGEAADAGRRRTVTRGKPASYEYAVRLTKGVVTDVSIPELGTRLRLKVIDWPSAERETTTWQGVLDLNRLQNPLVVRNWRPGDSYLPKGRRKTRKLKEMFLAARVPAYERASWPVLESGGRIAWAKGMEAAEEYCAREDTRAGVVIEECKR